MQNVAKILMTDQWFIWHQEYSSRINSFENVFGTWGQETPNLLPCCANCARLKNCYIQSTLSKKELQLVPRSIQKDHV